MTAPNGRGVLDGALRILRALPEVPVERQLSGLSRRTGIPRSSVRRLLTQLRDVGAVQLHRGHYVLAPELLGLTRRVEPTAGLRRAATGVMQALREQTGATVSLVVPTEHGLVALEMIPGREELPFDAYAGYEMPTASAAGQVLRPTGPSARAARSPVSAVDDEQVLPGVTCYAVRMVLPDGGTAALQIATSPRARADRFAAVVHRAAGQITSRTSGERTPAGQPAQTRTVSSHDDRSRDQP